MTVPKVLARGIATSMTLAALAVAGPALGGTATETSFSGAFTDWEGNIYFTLRRGEQKQTVRDMRISRMRANCEGENAYLNFLIGGATIVFDNRKFAVLAETRKGGKAAVQGRFNREFTQAEGTVRLHGKFHFRGRPGRSKCETNKQ